MNKVKILVQYCEGVYCAIASDEVGTIAQRDSTKDKSTAIRRVKEAVEEQIDSPTYTIEDICGKEKE